MSNRRYNSAGFDFQPESWMNDAACVGYPTDWWFPTNDGVGGSAPTESTVAARAICAECPVSVACLAYSMRIESGFNRFGIFGGVTPDARRRLAKEAS